LTILTATDGPVRIITTNRPQTRKAVIPATALALHAAFEAAMRVDAIGVVVLAGTDDTSCAGYGRGGIFED
jgi:1,4-dihydroxy-2-naphthoyl-CoA synthase